MDFQKIFDYIGQFGAYQCAMCIILVGTTMLSLFSNLNVVFIMGVTDYWCDVPALYTLNNTEEEIKNVTLPVEFDSEGNEIGYSQCSMYDRNYTGWTEEDVAIYLEGGNIDNASTISCKYGWIFDTEVYGNTATTEWDLVCDLRWWQAAASSFYALGLFSSLLLYGTLADMIGRKPALCGSYICLSICNFATAFAWNHKSFIVTRFFSGFFSASFYGGTPVYIAEIIGLDWRGHANAWFGYAWTVSGIVMAALAFAIKDWRILQVALSCLSLTLLTVFLLPESPRWLYIKGKRDEVEKILKHIAQSNGKEFNLEKISQITVNEKPVNNGYICDLFKSRSLTVRTIVICWNWFAASLCYYGLTLNSTSLGGNEYISFILSMLVEVPGVILCHWLTVKIGRKWPLVLSMIISSISLFFTLMFDKGSPALITLVSFGKMTCTLAFTILYLYTMELYPTVIRSISSSAANFCARLGTMFAPFIVQLSDFATFLPLIIFGISSLIAGLAAILLPETIGMDLQDTLQPFCDFDVDISPNKDKCQGQNNNDSASLENNYELVTKL